MGPIERTQLWHHCVLNASSLHFVMAGVHQICLTDYKSAVAILIVNWALTMRVRLDGLIEITLKKTIFFAKFFIGHSEM